MIHRLMTLCLHQWVSKHLASPVHTLDKRTCFISAEGRLGTILHELSTSLWTYHINPPSWTHFPKTPFFFPPPYPLSLLTSLPPSFFLGWQLKSHLLYNKITPIFAGRAWGLFHSREQCSALSMCFVFAVTTAVPTHRCDTVCTRKSTM